MTGALKPNSNTTQREDRVPLQKTLKISSQYLGDTKGVQWIKGLDNKRQVVLLRAESKGKLANLYLDQGGSTLGRELQWISQGAVWPSIHKGVSLAWVRKTGDTTLAACKVF